MTFASQHRDRTRARKEAAATAACPAPARIKGTLAERMLSTLNLHRAALKAIQSRQAKIAKKREFLPEYDAYIAGVLEADGGAQDDVATTIMLWKLDAGDFDGALNIADYAIRHALAMPDYISRDVPTTLIEEIADAALELTADCDMVDEVRAKGEKALGLSLKSSDPEAAIDAMESALALDPKCGVKTELNRLRKSLAAETGS